MLNAVGLLCRIESLNIALLTNALRQRIPIPLAVIGPRLTVRARTLHRRLSVAAAMFLCPVPLVRNPLLVLSIVVFVPPPLLLNPLKNLPRSRRVLRNETLGRPFLYTVLMFPVKEVQLRFPTPSRVKRRLKSSLIVQSAPLTAATRHPAANHLCTVNRW